MRLLQSLTETYSIDKDKIYTTGQSMGGMTSFHLSTDYPDFLRHICLSATNGT